MLNLKKLGFISPDLILPKLILLDLRALPKP